MNVRPSEKIGKGSHEKWEKYRGDYLLLRLKVHTQLGQDSFKWFGHCLGFGIASVQELEPVKSVEVALDGGENSHFRWTI